MKTVNQQSGVTRLKLLILVVSIIFAALMVWLVAKQPSGVTLANDGYIYTVTDKSFIEPIDLAGRKGLKSTEYGIFLYPNTSGLDNCGESKELYKLNSKATSSTVSICDLGSTTQFANFTAKDGSKHTFQIVKNSPTGEVNRETVTKILESLKIDR